MCPFTRTGSRDGPEGQRDAATTALSPPGLTFPPVQVPLKLDAPKHDLEEFNGTILTADLPEGGGQPRGGRGPSPPAAPAQSWEIPRSR